MKLNHLVSPKSGRTTKCWSLSCTLDATPGNNLREATSGPIWDPFWPERGRVTGPTKITRWLLGRSNSDGLCINLTYPDGCNHGPEKWILSHMDRDMARSWFGAVSCSGEGLP